VEAVLVRWQYSGIEWSLHPTHRAPAADGVVDDGDVEMGGAGGVIDLEVPEGFVELPGFKGVCVGVREDVLGTIRDVRPTAPRPSKVRDAFLRIRSVHRTAPSRHIAQPRAFPPLPLPLPCPLQDYLMTLPSRTLRDMWKTALKNQRRVLEEHEVRLRAADSWDWGGGGYRVCDTQLPPFQPNTRHVLRRESTPRWCEP